MCSLRMSIFLVTFAGNVSQAYWFPPNERAMRLWCQHQGLLCVGRILLYDQSRAPTPQMSSAQERDVVISHLLCNLDCLPHLVNCPDVSCGNCSAFLGVSRVSALQLLFGFQCTASFLSRVWALPFPGRIVLSYQEPLVTCFFPGCWPNTNLFNLWDKDGLICLVSTLWPVQL